MKLSVASAARAFFLTCLVSINPALCDIDMYKEPTVWDNHEPGFAFVTETKTPQNHSIKNAADAANQAYYVDQMQMGPNAEILEAVTPFGYVDRGGFVRLEADGNLTIAFHGTESWGDVWTDLWSIKKSTDLIGISGKAHAGFLNRYLTMRESLLNIVATHLKTNPHLKISITGHSMGGALATLAAADLGTVFKNKELGLVTFCSPRVFDNKGADQVTNLLGENNIKRFWRWLDPVSAVAPGWLGYKHVGQQGGFKLKSTIDSSWELLKNPGVNHSHESTVNEASSPEEADVEVGHRGVGGFKGLLKSVASKVKSFFSR